MILPDGSGAAVPGQVHHPNPLTAPADFQRCAEAAHLHYRWESASGGPVLGAEGIRVRLFNAGYPLQHAILRLEGYGAGADRLFDLTQPVTELPRGREITIEIASYEMPKPARRLAASLISAEFGPVE